MNVIRPYRGTKDYIAVGFCNQDREYALTIVEELVRNGYRVWFVRENGHGPEEAEKRNRIENCGLYLMVLSEAAVNAHESRKGLNIAMSANRTVVAVEISVPEMLSVGMQMQLEKVPKVAFEKKATFLEALKEMGVLNENLCEKEEGMATGVQYSLYREKTGERMLLSKKKNRIGRLERICQCVIRDNCTVSREHALIFLSDGICKLVDNHSFNGTFLNGQRLEPGIAYALEHGDRILLSNEEMIFQITNKTNE